MTALVDQVARRLVGLVSAWDYATDRALDPDKVPLLVADMPPDPDTAVSITTYPGGPEPDSRNGWEYPRMQVRVRARSPLDALDLDRVAYDALQATPGLYPVTLTGWLLQDCYALQSEAQPLGKDEADRWEFVRNYQLAAEAV